MFFMFGSCGFRDKIFYSSVPCEFCFSWIPLENEVKSAIFSAQVFYKFSVTALTIFKRYSISNDVYAK
jgi:hypothetical protein